MLWGLIIFKNLINLSHLRSLKKSNKGSRQRDENEENELSGDFLIRVIIRV